MGYKKYTDEFKRDVLAMVAEGTRSVAQLERDLDITTGLVYKWQQRYRVKGETLQPSEDRVEQAELRRLRREVEGRFLEIVTLSNQPSTQVEPKTVEILMARARNPGNTLS